ncbi:single-stranded DNA-binding protein [Gangjinia marincola]|uniref:Single-stranded DNA-binding protein n=2 Tax=Gangjinia marincola TaxID=578463 RepID=A0ABN1MFC4_9FLAO
MQQESGFIFVPSIIDIVKNNHLNLFSMNTLRNKVQLIGNLGNDPEILNLDSGKKLAKFSIATNESYKNAQGEVVKDTQWHNVVAWGKTAEIIEKYLVKGKEVAIEGKLTNRSYETKAGEKRYITEINCNELLMLGK